MNLRFRRLLVSFSELRPIIVAALVLGFAAAGFPAGALGAPAASQPVSASTSAPTSQAAIASPKQAEDVFANIIKDLPDAMKASQELLHGGRDPNGPSCASMPAVGSTDKVTMPAMPAPVSYAAGGLGQRLLRISSFERKSKSPAEDYEYSQKTLRPFVQKIHDSNAKIQATVDSLHDRADLLAKWFYGQKDFPAALKPLGLKEGSNWPDYCVYQLDQAITRKDLPACRQWSAETASAIFGLLDLHRWTGLLSENFLDSLDLLAQCEGLFADFKETSDDYMIHSISRFPGGSSIVAGVNNFYEVQHQSEGYFRKPDEFAKLAGQYHAKPQAAAAIALPPDIRPAFAKLRERLSPANQVVWDAAASRPFERSFMVNMLHRIGQAGALDQVGASMERFDKRFPKGGRVDQLMDVLVYRSSLVTAGLEWGDRFDERLMKAGGDITAAKAADALEQSRKFQYGLYGGSQNYTPLVLTLRKALDTGKMDCIRATDMIAAVLRDAGWPGFLHVRWNRGANGHSIAAIESGEGNSYRIDIVDGLFPPGKNNTVWPDSYFKGSPSGVYAVELFGRALDGFVVLETYIMEGPNAGKLTKRAIPYLPGHDKAQTIEHKPQSGKP